VNYGLETATIVTVCVIVFCICLIPGILFLLSLQRALSRCAPQNREMDPGMVWLMLIPLFSLVWQFILVSRVSGALSREFRGRGVSIDDPEAGRQVGIAMCILNLCSIIPYLGILASIGSLVCLILYWVKISGYSGRLAAPLAV
jgi:hypothetical protein